MAHTTLKQVLEANTKLTPMMEQYTAIKKDYDGHLLMFRMGDFYEVFFEDAVQASKLLNITLTHRGKIGDFPIPMAGIPHHAATAYVDRLTHFGLKVAICEQIEDPKAAKGIVKRAVTQVVSPGLPFDLDKTHSFEQKYIVATLKTDGIYYLVALDFTTGEFTGSLHRHHESFLAKLSLLHPKEMMTFMGQWDDDQQLSDLLRSMDTLKTYLSVDYFDEQFTGTYIDKVIPGRHSDHTLKEHQELLKPIGSLAYYICSTQQLDNFYHIKPFRLISEQGVMKVTHSTLLGLEILPKSRESYKDSLLGFMDRTQSALGTRALRKIFINPLCDQSALDQRQLTIGHFIADTQQLEQVREELEPVRDIERILAKVSTAKVTASDLINLARSTQAFSTLKKLMGKTLSHHFKLLKKSQITSIQELALDILQTLNDEVGASLDKGNLIKKGYSKKRDRLAKQRDHADVELAKIEEDYRQETGIPKLRVKSNNIAGYFIEVSKTHSNKVPSDFNRKQTLVNCERYVTERLTAFDQEMTLVKDKLSKIEREIFCELVERVGLMASELQDLAHVLGEIDAIQSLAWVSFQENFCKPNFVDKKTLNIQGMWHPMIKRSIKDQFVNHDLSLTDDAYFGLITGPNMAGKTTVMREVAIVQLLAQLGSYVPAESATLNRCDFLFSRLGACDDILKGQSTFMVEMAETAEIVRHATDKSLIILDEVGRGTSTYDGLSIAWALLEHLIGETKALGLFATHYHELIDVIDKMPQAKNLTVQTQNDGEHVKFLYNLIEQGASQSFGIYVAKLAGLPPSLLRRSQNILDSLEKDESSANVQAAAPDGQLSFFQESHPIQQIPDHLKQVQDRLQALDLNNMTPLETMRQVQEIQSLLH